MKLIAEEKEYYINEDESYVGVILLDYTDRDFGAIVLARDEQGKFSCMDVQASHPTIEDARNWLMSAMKWHTGTGVKVHPQGREQTAPLDLFSPVVQAADQHPYFQRLASMAAFTGARKVISEMMPHFIDIDGNFVQQFQSTGFDSRVWELYLFALLHEAGVRLDRSNSSPDFLGGRDGHEFALEAVIVGRRPGEEVDPLTTVSDLPSQAEVEKRLRDEMPIRFGSPLYSKLKKNYTELDHVKGKPFILAIADFHDDQSMTWSSSALHAYLYGDRYELHQESDGTLSKRSTKIGAHSHDGKSIPSGFFFQENSEDVSAILTTSTGTISKFNRIGMQAGFGFPGMKMIRVGYCYDHAPGSMLPKQFSYEVDESCSENWAEGVDVFHNPNAKVPLDSETFPFFAQHFFVDGMIRSVMPEFHPFSSITLDILPNESSGRKS